MKYNELSAGKHKNSRRVGRGIAAGQGKTAGRGTKGQKSRTGSGRKPGFEGGQNPLMQRLPKLPGFRSHHIPVETVYTGQLNNFSGTVDNQMLAETGLISNPYVKVKLLLNGEVSKKLTVRLQSASKGATSELKKKAGEFIKVGQIGRPAKKSKISEEK